MGLAGAPEVVGELPVGDVVADAFTLLDRVAEVEAEPDACIHHLVLNVLDGVEVLRGGQVAAAALSSGDIDVDVLAVDRRRERVRERGGEAAVLRRILGVTGHR
jgi:hypothetical protein